jgi:hypothetical protein
MGLVWIAVAFSATCLSSSNDSDGFGPAKLTPLAPSIGVTGIFNSVNASWGCLSEYSPPSLLRRGWHMTLLAK